MKTSTCGYCGISFEYKHIGGPVRNWCCEEHRTLLRARYQKTYHRVRKSRENTRIQAGEALPKTDIVKAKCPMCECRHNFYGWTGTTEPHIYCPDCRTRVGVIRATYDFPTASLCIPSTVKAGIRPAQ